MKRIITLIAFVIFLIIGIILLIIGNTNKIEKRDLYYEDIKGFSDFRNNVEYFIDLSHVEVMGRYFHTKSFSTKGRKSTRYYYNVKITNSKNQEYYMIMALNEGAKINMEKGELRDFSGTIHTVSNVIKDNQISSLEKKGITDKNKIYSIYLDVPAYETMKIIGIAFIIVSIFNIFVCIILIIRRR